MRIVIVEDDAKTSAFIQKGLQEHGFDVHVAVDGESGLHALITMSPALAIVDVMLPKLDGWSVLRRLRESGSRLPVLFLTARDDVMDRVRGLELGADDYLPKPFAFTELMARLRAILRRSPTHSTGMIAVGDLEIHPQLQKATRAGVHLHLTPKEMQLLSLLAQTVGEPVSRSRIAQEVWDIRFETGTNMVEAAMRRLRAKVDDGFEVKLIHTMRGVGYVLRNA